MLCNFHLKQIEHLKACSEIATTRVVNWQMLCQKYDSKLYSNKIQHEIDHMLEFK